VSGVALAAIGLWYDDYTAGGPNPVTPNLINVLGYTTGVEANDTLLKTTFPYVQAPWSGFGKCGGPMTSGNPTGIGSFGSMNIGAPSLSMMQNFPNPVKDRTTIKYRVAEEMPVTITVYDMSGKKVTTLVSNPKAAVGNYEVTWNAEGLSSGVYFATLVSNKYMVQTIKMVVSK